MQQTMAPASELNLEDGMIQSSPTIMMGKPVITGTRITVELILEKLAAGQTVDEIVAAYPRLTEESIQAALSFAARVMRSWSLPLTRYEDESDS